MIRQFLLPRVRLEARYSMQLIDGNGKTTADMEQVVQLWNKKQARCEGDVA